MRKKNLNVYCFKIVQEIENEIIHLRGNDLKLYLQSIREIPIDISKDEASRYSNPGSLEERCIVFWDEIANHFPIHENYIPAFFIRRRGTTRPFEEDGHGNLIELKLSNDTNQLAEVGFLFFCINEGIALWIFNPFVGGMNQLSDYLNMSFRKSKMMGKNRIPFIQNKLDSSIGFKYIIYPNALRDFNEDFLHITGLEFNFAGNREELKQAFLFEQSDIRGIELVRHFMEYSDCSRLAFNLHSEPLRKSKNKKEYSGKALNKKFIVELYDSTLPYLKSSDQNKFTVIGKNTIDDETKILDLINCKLIYPIQIEYEGFTMPLSDIIYSLAHLSDYRLSEMGRYINGQ